MEKKEIIIHTLSMYIECLKYILILIINSTYAHFSNTEVQNRPTTVWHNAHTALLLQVSAGHLSSAK